MIINKINLKYGHHCQIRNKKQKFKSLHQTKYVISATAVYRRSAYNDIQRKQIVTLKLNTMKVM